MTGYTVHTGSNEKFTDGWDRIFSEAGRKKKKSATAKKKPAKKKSPAKRKKAGKKKK